DSLGFEGDDGNEDSAPAAPALRAIDAVNPFDRCFADAKTAGITSVVTGPGSANPIGGQFAAVKTHGICVDDMIIKAPAAIKFALGENPKSVYHGKNQAPVTRMGTAYIIREALFKAREYLDAYEKHRQAPDENDKPDFDMDCEALIPLLKREIPAKFHAHRGDDICTAIRIAKEFDLDYTIEHCTDAESVLPVLERENSGVCIGPSFTDRSKPELKSLSFDTYKKLGGLTAAIITDHPETPVEYLPLCAAMAVKHGADKKKALEAITINAAKLCRIDARVGSIEENKDADFVICRNLPYEWDFKPYMTVINGQIVYTDEKEYEQMRCDL
ncbi:MAG: amidohydrolase family protein, partial [Oscillospiraceae bacterium]|nr:amidohydrolase family protein [Oscillospiraceae bacterium]